MSEIEYRRTNCRFCGYLCALIATIEDGQVTKVAPDSTRYPYSSSIQLGCRRWRAAIEMLEHSERVNYPLKRIGERGSGEWQEVSWDQALDDIAFRLQDLKDRFGPETLATCIGGPNAVYWPLHRFMNLFGSPNNVGIGQICWNPGVWINTLTYGWPIENELDPEITQYAIIWGTNPADSDNSLFWRTLLNYTQAGGRLVVVDPRRTKTANQAKRWLAIKPGADCELALGLLHVIIHEDLYDHPFVETWCTGFDQVRDLVAAYPPSVVEHITGVPAEQIVATAREFAAHKPAALITGRGIDQLGPGSAPTHRAIAILRAVVGSIDVPGASHIGEMPTYIPEVELELSDELPEAQRQKQLNRNRLLLQSYPGYDRVRQVTEKFGRRLPMRYLTSAHPDLVWKAMLEGDPYPVRSLIVMGNNPLLTQANTRRIYEALKSLDLLVALEYFITPTAMLADYVLPSAGILERPLLQTNAGVANIAYGGDQAVEPLFERKPDYYFWRQLGLRMGQADRWPWETFHESLEATLAPTGWTWQQFCDSGLYYNPSRYHKHEQIDPASGEKLGFGTPSGKVELASSLLAGLGYDALPLPKPTLPTTPDFPLTLITGARRQPLYASSLHQVDSLRDAHPVPLVGMCAETAARLGYKEKQPLLVETPYGKGRFVLQIIAMRPDVVSLEYGWWFPEMESTDPCLGGVWISNANALTSADIAESDPLIGSWRYNGIPCRVTPCK